MITYFIPFYNEEKKNIHKFLKSLKSFIKKDPNGRYIIIDDGSVDKTEQILKKFVNSVDKNSKKRIKFFSNIKNKGIGYSFKVALKICKTPYIMTLPSDNDLPFINYRNFVKKKIDLVLFYPINLEKYSRNRYLLSMLFRTIYGYFFNLKIHYIQGPFIARTTIIKKIKINSNRFSFWSEVNVKLLNMKIYYKEIPLIFKNNSKIDRTVSLKNFFEVVIKFIFLFFDIKVFNNSKYSSNPKKIYN
tara:strand:+ start:16 stop:750 length:735 start_codon:yes stop_codon:yes gene_type:complete